MLWFNCCLLFISTEFDCLYAALVGDGFCHDENNNVDCNYDGGDCCLSYVNTDQCSECICYGQETCAAGIMPSSVGDGFCNDETNNAICNYDGWDCCGSCVNTEHCIDCACLGNVTGLGVPNALVGDGYCNDDTNSPQCLFDGFDCCGSTVNTEFCSECSCHG